MYYTVQTVTTLEYSRVFLNEYPSRVEANRLRSVFTFCFQSP